MESRPPAGAPFPTIRQWKSCSHCGAPNPPWASGCGQCRQPFPDAREAAAEEAAHIEYLLQQLPGWRQHGLLSESAHQRLRSDYLHLQKEFGDYLLQQQTGMSDAAKPGVASSVTPAASAALPVASAAVNPALQSAAQGTPVFWPMDLPGILPGQPAAAAPGLSVTAAPIGSMPHTPPFTSAPAPSIAPPHPPAGQGLRRFFQKHALQVLFALATVLVLAALRTMLGWTWIGDLAMRLLPVVPLGLTAMFWTFGQKTRTENPWAAFAYHGLAAALCAFDVIAVNKYWLPTPLPAKPAFMLASLAAVGVSGALLRSWREIAYLHLFQTAAVTMLFAIAQMLRLNVPPGDFRLTPLWLFGAAYLSYAAFCLWMARRSEETTPDNSADTKSAAHTTQGSEHSDAPAPQNAPSFGQNAPPVEQNAPPAVSIPAPALPIPGFAQGAGGASWRLAWIFWAHFSVVGVMFLAAVNIALEHPGPNDFAVLSLLAGLIYVSGAQLLQDARMVRVSCVFLMASGLFWLGSHHPARMWEGASAFLLLLSALALVFARYNRQRANGHGTGEHLAQAYLTVGMWNVGVASILSCLYALLAFEEVGQQNYHVYGVRGCVLTLACGMFYFIFARWEAKPALLYAAFVTWAVGLTSLLSAFSASRGMYPLALTLYGVGLALLARRQSRRAEEVRADGLDWATPQRNSGIGMATAGALLAVGLPFQDTLGASWLWTVATLTLALLLYTDEARTSGAAVYAYAALSCAACISALLTWRVLVPQPFRPADCLAVFTLAASATSLVLARRGSAANGGITSNSENVSDAKNLSDAAERLEHSKRVEHEERVRIHSKVMWRECVTHAALVAALICLGDGVYAFCAALETRHYAVSLLPCLVSSLLLCGGRYAGNRNANDALRRSALACAGIAAAAEAGLLCHAWQGAGSGWQPTALRAWGISLVALGWAWKLAARLARNWNEQEWWRHELTLAALTTAFLGLLPLTLGAEQPPHGSAPLLFETAFAAAFALFALEADRTRRAIPVVFGLLIVALAALANRAFAPDGVTLTLAAYGIAYALLALRCREAVFVAAASCTLSAAYVHHLLSLTAWYASWYAPSHVPAPALSWPRFAFDMAQASLLWLLIGWQLRKRLNCPDLALPLLPLAGSLALASGIIALLNVQMPREGMWSILTLGAAGVAWFGLWAMEQGDICLHVATWNLLLAWGLVVYDHMGADAAFLDVYLLPVGLYLVIIGYLQSGRQRREQAQSLWTGGLLLTITPAFLAFWNHAGDIHTLLFIGECLVSALWGIWQRIRAFVLVGMGYIALYAAAVISGHLPDVWGTLVTLIVGVILFIAGFYILTHRAVMQRWAAVVERQWEAWKAWR